VKTDRSNSADRFGEEIVAKEILLRGARGRPERKRICQVKRCGRRCGKRPRTTDGGAAGNAIHSRRWPSGPRARSNHIECFGFRQAMQDLAETILVLDEYREDGFISRNLPINAESAVIPVIPDRSSNEIGKKAGNKRKPGFSKRTTSSSLDVEAITRITEAQRRAPHCSARRDSRAACEASTATRSAPCGRQRPKGHFEMFLRKRDRTRPRFARGPRARANETAAAIVGDSSNVRIRR